MPLLKISRSPFLAGVVLAWVVAGSLACAAKTSKVPTGLLEADKFLFERGQELLASKKWFQAREYFQQIVENYPQSQHRPDAKLGMGDTYIGEGSTESLVLAQNEFREFLTFYPTSPRADYAQYRLGYRHYKQMRSPDRDQTETKECVAEWALFVQRFPNSSLLPEVKGLLREARDRLDEADYRVGLYYFRIKWYPGAIDRFKALLNVDPDYTRRDAVYHYLAESMVAIDRKAEALPYFDKLVLEFVESEFLVNAQRRVAELKAATAPK